MKKLFVPALLLSLLLLLSACGGNDNTGDITTKAPTTTSTPTTSTSAPSTSSASSESSSDMSRSDAEAWKTAFEKDLLSKHGVVPDHYEKLADGTYRVYVNINGTVSPYVTVDPLTGEYSEYNNG